MKLLAAVLAIIILVAIYPVTVLAIEANQNSAQIDLLKSDAKLCRDIKNLGVERWQNSCLWHSGRKNIPLDKAMANCTVKIDSCSAFETLK